MEQQSAKTAKGSSHPLKRQSHLAEPSKVGGKLLNSEVLPAINSSVVDVSISERSPSIRQGKAAECKRNLPKLRDMREDVFFRAEYLYLHNLINLTGNNIRKACELSGLSRSRLYTLLKKYQITFHNQIFSH